MKKLSLVVIVAVMVCSLFCFAFAEPTTTDKVNEVVNTAGDTATEIAMNILDQAAKWSLPICAIFVVFGAVQYFIMGIRNLYKKRQGLLLMFGSMTFYVIILFVDLILTFLIA